jgi:hypothetical protein
VQTSSLAAFAISVGTSPFLVLSSCTRSPAL